MSAAVELIPEFGVAGAAAVLDVPRSSVYRRWHPPVVLAKRPRPVPVRLLSQPEQDRALAVLHESRFVDLSPLEIYAILLDEGDYIASPRTLYRLLAAHGEVGERRAQLRHERHAVPRLCADAPNQVWSWDITKLKGPVLVGLRVTRYLRVKVARDEVHHFKQAGPGRPGSETKYVRTTKHRFALSWHVDEKVVEQDRRHDGMYPLITNDRSLTPAQVLAAHKQQPRLERRFCQLKDVFHIAPAFLKNEDRIEALFFLYALALIVESLLEREIRRAMERESLPSLPIYPEERASTRPTAAQVLRLFSHVERHHLASGGVAVKTIHPELTALQKEVLRLLDVPISAYRHTP